MTSLCQSLNNCTWRPCFQFSWRGDNFTYIMLCMWQDCVWFLARMKQNVVVCTVFLFSETVLGSNPVLIKNLKIHCKFTAICYSVGRLTIAAQSLQMMYLLSKNLWRNFPLNVVECLCVWTVDMLTRPQHSRTSFKNVLWGTRFLLLPKCFPKPNMCCSFEMLDR